MFWPHVVNLASNLRHYNLTTFAIKIHGIRTLRRAIMSRILETKTAKAERRENRANRISTFRTENKLR